MQALNTTTVGGKPRPSLHALSHDFAATDDVTYTLSRMVRKGILPRRLLVQYTKIREAIPYINRTDKYFLRDMEEIAGMVPL